MNIIISTLKALSEAIVSPYYVFLLLIITLFFYRKNRKTAIMQKMIIGQNIESPFVLTISQVVLGVLAGAIGSIMLSCLGIVFKDDSAVFLLFVISLLLMIVGKRYVCFAYSGSILGAISIILNLASQNGTDLGSLAYLKVDVAMLMSLIAILHIVEGILVIFDGKSGAIPIFTSRDNKIIGGFALKRYWLLPIAMIFIINNDNVTFGPQFTITSLLNSIGSNSISLLKDALLGFSAFYGVLGYNSFTFTKTKHEKALTSGASIITYGIVLLLITLSLDNSLYAKIFLCIAAPLLHELMLRVQTYFEVSKKPKYVNEEEGIMILDVVPNSPAYEMGIKSGDIVMEINNIKIFTEEDILKSLGEVTNYIWLKIKNVQGKLSEVSYNEMNRTKKLGVLFVPKRIPKGTKVMKIKNESFDDVLDKIQEDEDDDES